MNVTPLLTVEVENALKINPLYFFHPFFNHFIESKNGEKKQGKKLNPEIVQKKGFTHTFLSILSDFFIFETCHQNGQKAEAERHKFSSIFSRLFLFRHPFTDNF